MYRFDGGTSEYHMEPRDYDPAIMEKKALAVYVAAENLSTRDQSLKIKFCYTVSIRSLSLRRFSLIDGSDEKCFLDIKNHLYPSVLVYHFGPKSIEMFGFHACQSFK